MLTFDGCGKGANPWVETYFHDCVYDVRDAVGFGLGICSIFVWLNAQLPQFFSNIKNQSAEALSIWFLVEWFAGDTLNLLGCLIQGQQLPTTTMLAAYFVLMDVIMLLQYIYYGALQARRKRLRAKAQRKRHAGHHHHHHHGAHHHGAHGSKTPALLIHGADASESVESTPLGHTPSYSEASPSSFTPSGAAGPADRGGAGGGRWRTAAVAATAGVSLVCVAALALRPESAATHGGGAAAAGGGGGLAAAGALARRHLLFSGPDVGAAAAAAPGLGEEGGAGGMWVGSGWHKKHAGDGGCSFLNCDVALVAGTVMGYLSTCFYLASRVSQIRKNLERKSTEGLSQIMFLLTISANLCTGVSIVMRLRTVQQLKDQLPWMCGTFGTIALDMTLFYQAITLGQHGHGHGHGAGHGAGAGQGQGGGPHGHAHGGSGGQHHHHGHHHGHGHGHGSSSANGHGGDHGGGGHGRGRALGGPGAAVSSDTESGSAGGAGAGGARAASDLEAPLLGPRYDSADG
ncbi:hypothetical protein GPECTOR_220g471 [Gonium pectorale]|uniref:Uncharacterized protein n=1 Tax=Gonium pectorale TaxID=33097 RepID=A0A150FWN1_GONPE|nr:hypothetical protein GPECTOR_220g471 [Gonium pectorale]|eukprot:KXZ42023.1 hypothetical protein GPECTOR_220g471 [Gonium pectorale]